MAHNFIKNQPFVFNHNNEFCGTEQKEVCLLTEGTDLLSFQSVLTPQGNILYNPTFNLGTNLINDSGFDYCASSWTFTGGWSCGFFNATKAAGSPAGYCQQLGYNFSSGGYIIKITVLSLGAGDSVDLYIGNDNVATIGANGTQTIHVESANGGNGFKIYADVGTSVVVDNVEVYYIGWQYLNGSGWDIDNGKACHTSGTAGTLDQYLLSPDTLYQVRLTISGRTTGSITVILGNNAYSEIFTNNGTYVIYGNSGSTYPAILNDTKFTISASTDFDGCIDNCYVAEVCNNVRVSIFDLDDNFVMEIPQTSINIENQIVNLSTTPDNLKLDEGCYRLKVVNPCSADGEQMILNWNFAQTNGVTADYWQYQDLYNNTSTVIVGGGNNFTLIAQFSGSDVYTLQNAGPTTMVVGKKYKFSYQIAANGNNTQIQVTIDGNIYNHNGSFGPTVHSQIFIAQNTSSIIEFEVTGDSNSDFYIDYASLVLMPEDYTYVYESNCFNFKETHECTKLFTWTDTKNGYGFYYGQNPITFNLRLLSEYRREKYVQNVTNFDDTTYKTRTIFATNREYKEVNIDSYPITIHRCIAIARLHKTFTIDGVISYPEIVDYEPQWLDFSKKFAQARFFIYQSTEQFNDCGTDFTADQNYLIDPETGDCVISLE